MSLAPHSPVSRHAQLEITLFLTRTLKLYQHAHCVVPCVCVDLLQVPLVSVKVPGGGGGQAYVHLSIRVGHKLFVVNPTSKDVLILRLWTPWANNSGWIATWVDSFVVLCVREFGRIK